jgi:hypothetical protein
MTLVNESGDRGESRVTGTSWLLFAVVEGLPARWTPPAEGPCGPVEVHRARDLAVIASPAPRLPEPGARVFALHADVVTATLDAEATLPFRFGVLLPRVDLAGWLTAHAERFRPALGQVRGSVEMDVKLLRLHCGHRVAGTCPACAPERTDADGLRALGEALAERAGYARWVYRATGHGGNTAASVAFLVPRQEVPAFLARIAPIASRVAGVAVVPTGPWPAYSFVPAIDRFPLARLAAAAAGGARRAV